jgi:hypothetical protein
MDDWSDTSHRDRVSRASRGGASGVVAVADGTFWSVEHCGWVRCDAPDPLATPWAATAALRPSPEERWLSPDAVPQQRPVSTTPAPA